MGAFMDEFNTDSENLEQHPEFKTYDEIRANLASKLAKYGVKIEIVAGTKLRLRVANKDGEWTVLSKSQVKTWVRGFRMGVPRSVVDGRRPG